MDIVLSEVEVRVLGSLVEKELTTPEYYPLSLVALVAACNQKSNRYPVMTLTSDDVTVAVDSLRGKSLAWQLNTAGGRVPKFEHNLPAKLKILKESDQQGDTRENPTDSGVESAETQNAATVQFNMLRREITIVCVLMLRGPLTVGEIRGCTGRMYQFKDLAEVEEGLAKLCDAGFAAKLPRAPGTKESRFCHCFCGTQAAKPSDCGQSVLVQGPTVPSGTMADRVTGLEKKVIQLTDEISAVKLALEEFKKKFE